VFTLKKNLESKYFEKKKRFSKKYSGLAEDRLHKISRKNVNDLSHRGVSTIIVGKNTRQKINNNDRRKFRGLFFSNTLKRINIDANVSFQIMKKIYNKFVHGRSIKYANIIVKHFVRTSKMI